MKNGFSKAQQILFRPLVQLAWEAHARRHGLDPRASATNHVRRLWYEGVLRDECGAGSTTELDRTRGFESAMAAFEIIIGESIEWQMRRFSGDRRRIVHEIRQVCAHYDADEHYMRGIAKQALQRDDLPELHTLEPGVLLVILRAIKIDLKRKGEIHHGWPGGHIQRPPQPPTESIKSISSTPSTSPLPPAPASVLA